MTIQRKKVTMIVESFFSERDVARYGSYFFIDNDVDFEVLDLSPLLRPHHFNELKDRSIRHRFHKLIFSKEQFFKEIISSYENTIAICKMSTGQENNFIFRCLEDNKIPYGFAYLGEIPMISNIKFSSWSVLVVKLKKVIKKILKLKSLLSPSFVIVSGSASVKKAENEFFGRELDYIYSHCLDYDNFLAIKDEDRDEEEPFAVFIDEDQPFHEDYNFLGIEPPCQPDIYYSEVNRFFDNFEKSFGIKVVIAGHPRANYKDRNPYGSRKIIQGMTHKLIQQCTQVIGHASTSLSYAVLFSKPITLLNSDNYHPRLSNSVSSFAKELGIRDINLTHTSSLHSLPAPNREGYEDYKRKYIKLFDGIDENKASTQIFLDYLVET
tara:strand:- start:3175 stop:4317 length:1143 start_codon:yes stop_codon:yes gene_type:complete